MRKLFMLTGSIGLICACGDAVPEPEPLADEEAETTSETALVDAIDHEGEHIEFWEVGDPAEPEILMTTVGPAPGVLAREDQDATPAEIWIAATGRTDVPEKLLLDHERARALTGRSFELRAVNIRPPRAEVEDKALSVAELVNMFPLNSGFCYASLTTTSGTLNATRPDGSICSIAPAFTGLMDIAAFFHFGGSQFPNDCSQTKEVIRLAGHYRDTSGADSTAQICFLTGGALFASCNPAVRIPPNNFFGSEFGKSSNTHSLKLNMSSRQPNGTLATDTWGAGSAFKLVNQVPAFQRPTCE
jgi:hypothetical protein